jgi:hypothetical protein
MNTFSEVMGGVSGGRRVSGKLDLKFPGGDYLVMAGDSCNFLAMDDRIISDARFADLAKVRQARLLTPEMKFRAGSDLFEEACRWTLSGIAARFPQTTEAERIGKLRRLLKLAEQARP